MIITVIISLFLLLCAIFTFLCSYIKGSGLIFLLAIMLFCCAVNSISDSRSFQDNYNDVHGIICKEDK